jgi:hypothetical protein
MLATPSIAEPAPDVKALTPAALEDAYNAAVLAARQADADEAAAWQAMQAADAAFKRARAAQPDSNWLHLPEYRAHAAARLTWHQLFCRLHAAQAATGVTFFAWLQARGR